MNLSLKGTDCLIVKCFNGIFFSSYVHIPVKAAIALCTVVSKESFVPLTTM